MADSGGVILLARIYSEPGYIDSVTRRALEQLAGQPTPALNLNEALHQVVGATGLRSGS